MIDFILGAIVLIVIASLLMGAMFAIAADIGNLRLQGIIALVLAFSLGIWYFFL